MAYQDSKGREVEDLVVCGASDDIQIESASYVDTGEAVPDDELEWIASSYASDLYDDWYQNQVGRAEAMAEAWKDGTYD